MTDWQTFIKSQTASAESSINQLDNSCALIDLSQLGLLKMNGADAISFLQGQVTNDVTLLGNHPNCCHYTGYCTAKGRLLALFMAFRHNDDIYLQLPQSILASVMKRLKMYVLRAKVNITDVSAEYISIGLAGQTAVQVVSNISTNIPNTVDEVVAFSDGFIIKRHGITPRFELIIQANSAQTIWAALSQHSVINTTNLWDLLEIEAGIPEVIEATQEKFVPQMINLDLLGGINFKKGCYTGQEIVARTHYLGKVKRRTLLASLSSTQAPKVGDDITINNENAGTIVRVANNANGEFTVLVEMHLESQANGQAMWNGQALTFKTMPYAL